MNYLFSSASLPGRFHTDRAPRLFNNLRLALPMCPRVSVSRSFMSITFGKAKEYVVEIDLQRGIAVTFDVTFAPGAMVTAIARSSYFSRNAALVYAPGGITSHANIL